MLKLARLTRLLGPITLLALAQSAQATCDISPPYIISAPGQSVQLTATCSTALTSINWSRDGASVTNDVQMDGVQNAIIYQTPALTGGKYTYTAVGNGGAEAAGTPGVVIVGTNGAAASDGTTPTVTTGQCMITTSVRGGNGTITPTQSVACGTTTVITLTPRAGYVVSLSADPTACPAAEPLRGPLASGTTSYYEFRTTPTGDCTVSASYRSAFLNSTTDPVTPTAGCGAADGGSYTDGGTPKTATEFGALAKCDTSSTASAVTAPGSGNNYRYLWTCTNGSATSNCSRRVGYTITANASGSGSVTVGTRTPAGSTNVVGGGGTFSVTATPGGGASLTSLVGTAACGSRVSTTFTGVTGDCTVTASFSSVNLATDPAMAQYGWGQYGYGLWQPSSIPANVDGTGATALSAGDWVVADQSAGPGVNKSYIPGCLNGTTAPQHTGCTIDTSYTGSPAYAPATSITVTMPHKVLSIRYWAKQTLSGTFINPTNIAVVASDGGGITQNMLVWLTDQDNPTRSYAATAAYNQYCAPAGAKTVQTGPSRCPIVAGKLYYLNMYLNDSTSQIYGILETNSDFVW